MRDTHSGGSNPERRGGSDPNRLSDIQEASSDAVSTAGRPVSPQTRTSRRSAYPSPPAASSHSADQSSHGSHTLGQLRIDQSSRNTPNSPRTLSQDQAATPSLNRDPDLYFKVEDLVTPNEQSPLRRRPAQRHFTTHQTLSSSPTGYRSSYEQFAGDNSENSCPGSDPDDGSDNYSAAGSDAEAKGSPDSSAPRQRKPKPMTRKEEQRKRRGGVFSYLHGDGADSATSFENSDG